ncbi:MAG: chorismate mutase [Actinobacteria bacterium]|nr:chorismate mutase [Actinomycetota bacterium]
MSIRAARGAIAIREDTREEVLGATERLMSQLLQRNGLGPDQLISVIFTTTSDLRAAFPAEAARQMGLSNVPLLCASEIDVEGAMKRVVRVLIHFESDGSEVSHVYMEGAESLRDDL